MRSDIDALACLQSFVREFPPDARQKKAAAELGITPQYLSDLLKGRRRFSDSILEKLGLRRAVVRRETQRGNR